MEPRIIPGIVAKTATTTLVITHAKESNTSSKDAYRNSLAFRTLPADEKKRAVALSTGMGYDPIEAENALAGGKTLTELADAKGLKVNDVTPVVAVLALPARSCAAIEIA